MAGYTRSTIKSILEGAVSRWIKAIEEEGKKKDDEDPDKQSLIEFAGGDVGGKNPNKPVIDAIRKDAIITGGAIASMLLGDKPNDIDLYFRTTESATIVAKYYLEKIKKPANSKVGVIDVRPNNHGGVAVFIKSAGVAGEETDLDQYEYFESKPEEMTEEYLAQQFRDKELKKSNEVAYMSSNAITLKNDIQIVLRFCGEPEEIHKNYDFVHATSWYDVGSKTLVLKPEAMEALLQKRLVYVGSKFPIASLFRVRKFIQRGFEISAGELTKISYDISRIDMENPVVLSDQLMGVDQAYFHQVISILKDAKKEDIDRTYLFKIINDIFDGQV